MTQTVALLVTVTVYCVGSATPNHTHWELFQVLSYPLGSVHFPIMYWVYYICMSETVPV